MPQITMVALISDGTHVVCNNSRRPWAEFRVFCLHSILDALHASPAPGPHVLGMTIAHHDHFHLIEGQSEVFAVLSDLTSTAREAAN